MGSVMERYSTVPTADAASIGVKRKKFRGETVVTSNLLASISFRSECAAQPVPRTTTFFMEAFLLCFEARRRGGEESGSGGREEERREAAVEEEGDSGGADVGQVGRMLIKLA